MAKRNFITNVSKYVFYNKTRKGRPKKNKQPEPKEKENQQKMKDKVTKDKPKQKAKQHLKDKQNVKKELPKINIKLPYKDGSAGDKEEMKFAGETLLHEACRLNKPAEVYKILMKNPAPPDVNAKNSVGYTALHIVCLSDAHLCAKILIEECGESCDLLNEVDKSGRKPHHYTRSKEMEEILKDYFPPDFNSDVEETTVEETSVADEEASAAVEEVSAAPEPTSEPFNLDQPIPPMNNFKESALHFHALQYLLCYYSDVYHIFEALELINKGQSDKIHVYKHEDKACLHYKSYEEMTLCSVDFEIAKHQPTIIKNFLVSAVKSAEEKNLSLDLELLPLKMYLAALSS